MLSPHSRAFVALALFLACLSPATLLSAAPPTGIPDSSLASNAAQPTAVEPDSVSDAWAGWIVSGALRIVAAWALDQVVDHAMDRAGIKRVVDDALNNLFGIQQDASVPTAVRSELRQVGRELQEVRDLLARNDLNDRQVRRELNQLRGDFQAYVRQTERRLAAIEGRLVQIERQQRVQLRMIVDLDRRVALVEGRLARAETQIIRLQDDVAIIRTDVDSLQEAVFPNEDRFLRHEAYLAGGLLYANSPSLGGEAAVGGEITAQYNFNEFLGVFAGLAYMPLTAADIDSVSDGSSVTWDNANVHLGAVASVLGPRNPVSVQLGAGAGIASSRLMFYPAGVERTSENGQELGTSSNVYMLVKAEVGVAPPAYSFEPIATFGYIAFMDDVAYEGSEVSSNVGRSLWFVSLGVRFRQYLRGSAERRNLPAGLGSRY